MAQSVSVAGGYVHVADNRAGMEIYRECGLVFSDGFESGTSSAWSVTVP